MNTASESARADGTRPSSARRMSNLRALVEEFGNRDLGCAGAALFLGCSYSSARNYLAQLLDAGVVASHPVRLGAGCIDRTLYRLTADPLVVHRFLAALAGPTGVQGMPAHGGTERLETAPHAGSTRIVWRNADFSLAVGYAPTHRDPLVAALFGVVTPGAQPRSESGPPAVAVVVYAVVSPPTQN